MSRRDWRRVEEDRSHSRPTTSGRSKSSFIDEEILQKEIEFILSRFETVKKRKAIIDEQLFMVCREKDLLIEELAEASKKYNTTSAAERRRLNLTMREFSIVSSKVILQKSNSVNETEFALKQMRQTVSYNRKAFLHLGVGLYRLKKKNKYDELTLQSLSKSLETTRVKNEEGLDKLVVAKKKVDGMNQDYQSQADQLVKEGKASITSINNPMERDRLNKILDEREYIDSFPLTKDRIRRLMLVRVWLTQNNHEKNNLCRVYKHTLSQLSQKLEKVKADSGAKDLNEFTMNFVEMEGHLQNLMNRIMYLVSECNIKHEEIQKERAELQTLKLLDKDFKNSELNSVIANEETARATKTMLLEHRLEKERDYCYEVNNRFERFFKGFDLDNPLHNYVIKKKDDFLIRELPDNCEVFTELFSKTLLVDKIIKQGPEEENRFVNYVKEMKQKHSLEISNKLLENEKKYVEPETSDDQTSAGSEEVE